MSLFNKALAASVVIGSYFLGKKVADSEEGSLKTLVVNKLNETLDKNGVNYRFGQDNKADDSESNDDK